MTLAKHRGRGGNLTSSTRMMECARVHRQSYKGIVSSDIDSEEKLAANKKDKTPCRQSWQRKACVVLLTETTTQIELYEEEARDLSYCSTTKPLARFIYFACALTSLFIPCITLSRITFWFGARGVAFLVDDPSKSKDDEGWYDSRVGKKNYRKCRQGKGKKRWSPRRF